MKKRLLLLCLLAHAGMAQTPRLDSLKQALGNLQQQPNDYGQDTLRFQTLKAIMRGYVNVDIDSASRYNNLMIRLCDHPRLQNELVYAYQYAGYLYQLKGDYHEATQYYYKALSLAEQLNQPIRVAISLGGLGHAYTSLKEYGKATTLCRQGLGILQKNPDSYTKVLILNVLGAIYREQGQLVNALRNSQTMYELAKAGQHRWYEAQGLHTIGWTYSDMGNITKALLYYDKALTLCRQTGSIDLEGSILLHISDAYNRQQQWQRALAYCNLAKQAAVRVKNSSLVTEADEKLYTIFKQTGQSAKALTAYEDFVALRDSLSSEKNQQRIGMLETQYNNVKLTQTLTALFGGIAVVLLITALLFWNNRALQAKNRAIDRQRRLLEATRKQLADSNKTLEIGVAERTSELLTANRELIRKNEEIKGALFKGQAIERKRVAIELHDNLSSLLSAVNMSIQAINPQNLSEAEQSVYRNVKQLVQNAYAEVRNISHNILPAELEREGLASTLTTLIGQLNQNSPLQFQLTLTGFTERLPIEIEFNAYSIVLELLNNAIKHANATTIGVSLLRTDVGVELWVTDDGVGLGRNQDKRGVGLQNIQARLDSLGGTFNSVRPAEKGTRIHINIPIDTVRVNGNVVLT